MRIHFVFPAVLSATATITMVADDRRVLALLSFAGRTHPSADVRRIPCRMQISDLREAIAHSEAYHTSFAGIARVQQGGEERLRPVHT